MVGRVGNFYHAKEKYLFLSLLGLMAKIKVSVGRRDVSPEGDLWNETWESTGTQINGKYGP